MSLTRKNNIHSVLHTLCGCRDMEITRVDTVATTEMINNQNDDHKPKLLVHDHQLRELTQFL